ncbi:hypothetical protein HDU80_005319 [Chytriomyces hyalinus]|nr:hypothetical protein HDU80_005319 [Chytriomyces hyalinus]
MSLERLSNLVDGYLAVQHARDTLAHAAVMARAAAAVTDADSFAQLCLRCKDSDSERQLLIATHARISGATMRSLNALLVKAKWPAQTAQLEMDQHFKNELSQKITFLTRLHIAMLLFTVSISNARVVVETPLQQIFSHVLTRLKFHFFAAQKATNRMDKPEWLLNYTVKLIEDHGPFLDLVQDILDQVPENRLIAKTEYISHLMNGFVKDRIRSIALKLMNHDAPLFSHLLTEVMRFDKTLQNVHLYYGSENANNDSSKNLFDGSLLVQVFCMDPILFQPWLDIEAEVAQMRLTNIMKADPWVAHLDSSSDAIKHTNSSEKLLDLLSVITDRYKNVPPLHQLAFFEQLQLRLLNQYLEIAKDTLNAYQSTFQPTVSEAAVVSKFERLENVLSVAASLDAIVVVTREWGEEPVFLEMLAQFNVSESHEAQVDGNADERMLSGSMFKGVEADYMRVILQIEDITADDCLQYIVESMWRYDLKNWSTFQFEDETEKDSVPVSPELSETLGHLVTLLSIFDLRLAPRRSKQLKRIFLARLLERFLERIASVGRFSLDGAVQFARNVHAFLNLFPGVVKQTGALGMRLMDTLTVLQMSPIAVQELRQVLARAESAGAGGEQVLVGMGILCLTAEQVKALLRKRG